MSEVERKAFRKKPVVIEAVCFDGSIESARFIAQWANADDASADHEEPTITFMVGGDIPEGRADDMVIQTLEGGMSASVGDWIIRGVKGEFYACKPDIFAATYEPADRALTPADERVEAVARALHAEGSHKPWERVHESEQAYWRRKARAAIAAMGGGRD